MRTLFHSFLLLIAKSTDRQLAEYLEFLKVENRILRSKLPNRIVVTPKERTRLLKHGKPLGTAIRDLITIVSPRTFLRWVQDEKKPARIKARKSGRPATSENVQDLIIRLARENGWGYTRMLGELAKLGVTVSRSTVIKILKQNSLEPGPKRGGGSWHEFVRRHLDTLWACDFFSVRVWTMSGLVDMFVFFVIQVGSRRVQVTGITPNPDGIWMKQQARNLAIQFAEEKNKASYLIRDMDAKFAKEFDSILAEEGVTVVKVGPRAPNMNAYAERFVQSIKDECLRKVLIFGDRHLRYLIKTYLDHYHTERPHQGVGNVPLCRLLASSTVAGEIECHERLGGLLKSYSRKAA